MRKFFWALEVKFLTFLLLPVILATILASIAFGISTYRDMMSEFRNSQADIAIETSKSIAEPMWNLDESNALRLLNAVVDGVDVYQALILDPYNTQFIKVGDLPVMGSDSVKQKIVYSLDGKDNELGMLILSFGSSSINHAIANQIFRDSIYLLVLVLFIMMGAYITIKRVVRKPLEALIKSIRKSVELHSYEEAPTWESNDELGEVTETYNQMVRKISDKEMALHEAISIAEQEREKAEILARTDSLTNLNNRRALFDYGRLVEDQSHRSGRPYTVILMDIDHFKTINDTYGHKAGDNVLREISIAILSIVRDADIPGRIGGDEFAVILPETIADRALNLAERLRGKVAGLSMPFDDMVLTVTASFGVAESSGGKERIEKVISYADEALYKSKESSRNMVSLYEVDRKA